MQNLRSTPDLLSQNLIFTRSPSGLYAHSSLRSAALETISTCLPYPCEQREGNSPRKVMTFLKFKFMFYVKSVLKVGVLWVFIFF